MKYREDFMGLPWNFSVHIHVTKGDTRGEILSAMVAAYNRAQNTIEECDKSVQSFLKKAKSVIKASYQPSEVPFKSYGWNVVHDNKNNSIVYTRTF